MATKLITFVYKFEGKFRYSNMHRSYIYNSVIFNKRLPTIWNSPNPLERVIPFPFLIIHYSLHPLP